MGAGAQLFFVCFAPLPADHTARYSLSDFNGYQFSLFPSLANPMGLINDYCGPDRSPARKARLPPPNCCYTAAKINGWPHIFVVTLRPIARGEALTVMLFILLFLLFVFKLLHGRSRTSTSVEK